VGAAAIERTDSTFALDVRAGLTRPGQKELPSVYLYDALGSTLFDAITLTQEYGLTRADERILRRHAGAIVERLPMPLVVTELGSGSGRKTRWILEELARSGPVTYYPIDISAAALARCKLELAAIGSIGVVGLEQPYLDGLREVAARRSGGEALLVLFLGSTIGNFDRAAGEEFLRAIRSSLCPADGLLLGTDLVKPPARLIAAYDDATGVTAAFNLNLLARINRELGGNFVLRHFVHEARYDRKHRRIEMHLVSVRRQTVAIPGAGITVTFEKGESIWTEACHKFQLHELDGIATRCGFRSQAHWVDPQWPLAESLWIAA
jgi:dimethylhistidine N-methyltransferase